MAKKKDWHMEELVHMLDSGESYNFLAVIYTPWHFLGAKALIRRLGSQGKMVRGFVAVGDRLGEYLLDISKIQKDLGDAVQAVYLTPTPKTFAMRLAGTVRTLSWFVPVGNKKPSDRTIYLATARKPLYALYPMFIRSKAITCILDEGLGQYIRDTHGWIRTCLEQKNAVFTVLKESLKNYILENYYRHILARRRQAEDHSLLQRAEKTGWYQVNRPVAESYKQVLKQSAESITVQNADWYADCILINTQPLWEDGYLGEDVDLALLQELVRRIRPYGIPVVLKPHPREKNLEKYQRLGCLIDTQNSGIPQEVILASLTKKPKMICSFFSTTLVTGSIFEDIPGVSLGYLLKRQEARNPFFNEISSFEKLFGDIVRFPKNREDLETIITESR